MVAKQIVIEDMYFDQYNKEPDVGISRGKSMKLFMDDFKSKYPEIEVTRAKRVDGVDLFFKYDKVKLKANFYHSKTHKTFYPSSWHVVDAKEIELSDSDIYIFNLKYYNDMHAFIYTKDEILEYIKDKKKDNADKYHFNFEIKNGKFLEVRDYIKNVKKYHNKQYIIQKILKDKNKSYKFF